MDTSDYPSLPNLCQLNARLAQDCRRVESVIDSQLSSIEQLFTAVTEEDWSAVEAVTRYLAELKPSAFSHEVIREARQVVEELSHASSMGQPKHLPKLLAACRELRKNRSSKPT